MELTHLFEELDKNYTLIQCGSYNVYTEDAVDYIASWFYQHGFTDTDFKWNQCEDYDGNGATAYFAYCVNNEVEMFHIEWRYKVYD